MQTEITLGILAGALLLLASQKVRPDLVALLVMVGLIAGQVLTPEETFQALGRSLIVTVAGVFVVGEALRRTGVAVLLSERILAWGRGNRSLTLLLIMLTGALLSALLSSMLITVLLIPTIVRIGRELEITPAQLLLPMVTVTLLGNQLTLIATPANLVVDDLLTQQGEAPLGFFTITPYGVVSVALAMGWYWFMGHRTLPDGHSDEPSGPSISEIQHSYGLDNNFYQLRVRAASDLVDSTLADSMMQSHYGVEVVAIHRAEQSKAEQVRPYTVLQVDDLLVFKGQHAVIEQYAEEHSLELQGATSLASLSATSKADLYLFEAVIPYRSPLAGQTLAELAWPKRYGIQVLALNRQGESVDDNLSELPLQTGDILLVQGSVERVRAVGDDANLVIITDLAPAADETVTSKVPIALTVTGVALLAVILNWVSLAVALLVASLLFIVTRTLTIEQAYTSINAKILVLLAGMLPLATALQQTGAADLLANLINRSSAWIGGFGALFLLYLCGVLMTQVAPNSVTAAVLTPVATQLAAAQEMPPRLFAIAIIFAAGASWLTPLISSSNLLVQSKGNYRLTDFLRNTIPIFLLQAAALFGLLMIWG